jgi:LemA protein
MWWTSFLYIILGIFFVLLLLGVIIYNRFMRSQQRCKEAWADIDVQLQRRYNLIPNLLETVKGFATHEKEVLTEVTEARAKAVSASEVGERSKAEGELSRSLKSLFAVAENYPQLKSAPHFLELQKELADTENKIQAARRFYNNNVKDYNTRLAVFPDLLVAKQLKLKPMDLFEVENPEVRQTPKVSFN